MWRFPFIPDVAGVCGVESLAWIESLGIQRYGCYIKHGDATFYKRTGDRNVAQSIGRRDVDSDESNIVMGEVLVIVGLQRSKC